MSIASVPSNFDRVAPLYRWLEYFTFGGSLKTCREWRLPEMAQARRALVLGDGDGRFLAALLKVNPNLCADVVDTSGTMLNLLRQRTSTAIAEGRVRTYQSDALTFIPPASDYDLVITHFFLDCFTTEEVATLARRLNSYLSPRAGWVVSEFSVPRRRVASLVSWEIISVLYFSFRFLAGLKVCQLPDHERVFRSSGFRRLDRKTWFGGLIISELWRNKSQRREDPLTGEHSAGTLEQENHIKKCTEAE